MLDPELVELLTPKGHRHKKEKFVYVPEKDRIRLTNRQVKQIQAQLALGHKLIVYKVKTIDRKRILIGPKNPINGNSWSVEGKRWRRYRAWLKACFRARRTRSRVVVMRKFQKRFSTEQDGSSQRFNFLKELYVRGRTVVRPRGRKAKNVDPLVIKAENAYLKSGGWVRMSRMRFKVGMQIPKLKRWGFIEETKIVGITSHSTLR